MFMESFETRRLFAISFPSPGNWLTLNGTNHDDHITLGFTADHSKLDVGIDGKHQQYPLGVIARVIIYGKKGNDFILIDETNGKILGGIEMYGGEGDDTLIGGSGPDAEMGNNGNDLLIGGAGDDGLNGGNGSDTLIGGAGNDLLSGGDGTDRLNGGDGNDLLDAGGGRDIVYGGGGSDVMFPGNKHSEFRDRSSEDGQPDVLRYRSPLTRVVIDYVPNDPAPS
jgi:Ca2+-binding RTX toxin-like protein